ncbi:MAG: hypothetical protein IKA44_05810 [Clostridia bacterium]|nr:hypothetical protein [Clostridia bacterium]
MEECKLTVKEILEATRALNNETQHIEEALKQLQTVKSIEGPSPDLGAQAKANAIAKVVEVREKTIQKTLAFYEKMYNNIQAPELQKIYAIDAAFVNNMAYIADCDISPDDKYAALGYVTDKIAELAEKIIIKEN